MRDVRVDAEGALHCWKCGGKNFDSKRTGRAKLAVGIGALVTKKKLKCQLCGEYNQTGNAKPYKEPASRKHRKRERSVQAARGGATAPAPPPPPAGPPEGWYPDPHGQAAQRWWDGSAWTGAIR